VQAVDHWRGAVNGYNTPTVVGLTNSSANGKRGWAYDKTTSAAGDTASVAINGGTIGANVSAGIYGNVSIGAVIVYPFGITQAQ
jgi:hypothetical protein